MSEYDVDDWEQRQVDQDEEDYMNYLMLRGTQPESNPEPMSRNRNSQGEDRYVARAFAAIPGNYGRNNRTPLRETADNRNTYWKNNACVDHLVTWNGKSVNLPNIAPFTEATHIKRTILDMTVMRLINADTIPWNDRCDILANRFHEHAPIVDSQAKSALTEMKSPLSVAYSFDNLELVDNTLRVLPLGNNLTANNRRSGRYAQFNTFIAARNLIIDPTEFPSLNPTSFPLTVNFVTYVSLPRVGNLIHPEIDYDILTSDPQVLMATMATMQIEVVLMAIGRGSRSPTAEAAEQFLKEYYNKTRFAALGQLLRPLYVGKMVGLESLGQRLQALTMTQHNPGGNGLTFLTVQELFQQYQTHLAEVDTEGREGDNLPCLTTLFYTALSRQLKQKLEDQVPPMPPTTFANNVNRLIVFVHAAKKAESDLRSVAAIASSAARRSQPIVRTAPRQNIPNTFAVGSTFMGISTGESEGYDIVFPKYSTETELRELYCTNLVLLSSAEQAMRQASGMKAPLLCWGCEGLAKFNGKDNAHNYRDCPNKQDPEVVQNFLTNLQKYRDGKKNRTSTYGPSPADRNWSALGYSSKEQYSTLQQIVDPTTSKQARKALIATLSTIPTEDDKEDGRKKLRIFLSYSMNDASPASCCTNIGQPTTFRTFIAPQFARFQFPISEALPFIDLPIGSPDGDDDQHIFIRGLADTGGCCTMAWKPYMLKLKQKFPDLVESHTVLKERQFEDIRIGGIQGGVYITDVIVFYMPFSTNGSPHAIMFGLTDDLPINVLYGLPFMIQAQITLDIDGAKATSKLLGTTFKLNMQSPRRDSLETIDYKVGARATYHNVKDTTPSPMQE